MTIFLHDKGKIWCCRVDHVCFFPQAGVLNSNRTWDLELPNAARFGATGLYIPSHSFLEQQDVKFIVGVIEQFFIDSAKKVDGRSREKGWVDRARATLLGE